MFCKNCGAELQEGTRFCSRCGANLSGGNVQKPEKKVSFNAKELFSGTKKKYASAILGVLVVAVLLFAILVLPDMALNGFKSQIKDREYRDAYLTYEEFNSEDRTKANKWMREYIDTVEEDYYAGKLDYSTAAGILEELMRFDAAYNEASKADENVYLDNQSAIVFDRAKEYAAEGKWREAYEELEDVHIKYRLYDEVSTLRNECVTNIRAGALEQIDAFAASGEIDKLIEERNLALTVLPDDKEIIQAAQAHLDAFVTKTLADAETLAEGNDYSGAMDLLQYAVSMYEHQDLWSALEGYGYDSAEAHCEALVAQNDLLGAVAYANGLADTDSKYKELLQKYAEPLVEETLATAKEYADKREYEQAINTIETVQKVYDCNELQAAVETYTSYLLIRLVDCYVVTESKDFETGATDAFGNERTESLVMTTNSVSGGDIVYNLDGRYLNLSGEMVHGVGGFYDASVQIKIYLDDSLVYTSAEIAITTQPIPFSLDVTGGKLLRIEIENVSYCMWGGRCIIDATLS